MEKVIDEMEPTSSLADENYQDTNLTLLALNMTKKTDQTEELLKIYQIYLNNRSLQPSAFWSLIIVYSIVVALGTTGNLFVVAAVARKPTMRTARNMFILNLAISDLLLCLVTTPLTLMEVLTAHWPFVKWSFVCGLIGLLQGISVFVSTITITAIALDRYQVIINPTQKSLDVVGALAVVGCIWIIALILVSPIYMYRNLYVHNLGLDGLETIGFCQEEWPIAYGRAYYSGFSLVVQYIIPIIIVSTAYIKIYLKLKERHSNANLGLEANKERERGRKFQKTNSLLMSIAIVYGVSWLPLNLLNFVSDIYMGDLSQETFLIIFSITHIMGMSSACSNPLLYGWLNENFRKEFQEILACGKVSQPSPSAGRKRESPNTQQNVKFEFEDVNIKTQDSEDANQIIATGDTDLTTLAR